MRAVANWLGPTRTTPRPPSVQRLAGSPSSTTAAVAPTVPDPGAGPSADTTTARDAATSSRTQAPSVPAAPVVLAPAPAAPAPAAPAPAAPVPTGPGAPAPASGPDGATLPEAPDHRQDGGSPATPGQDGRFAEHAAATRASTDTRKQDVRARADAAGAQVLATGAAARAEVELGFGHALDQVALSARTAIEAVQADGDRRTEAVESSAAEQHAALDAAVNGQLTRRGAGVQPLIAEITQYGVTEGNRGMQGCAAKAAQASVAGCFRSSWTGGVPRRLRGCSIDRIDIVCRPRQPPQAVRSAPAAGPRELPGRRHPDESHGRRIFGRTRPGGRRLDDRVPLPRTSDEIIRLGQRGMHALLIEVLEDVDVSALPVVGPGLR